MLLTVLSFVLVMSLLVFAHELGHFLVAKRNHIVVEEFAFGFPPRLVKLGERGGTVYSINAIPFGGYVRMRGEDDPSLPGSFASASKLARTATLLAGATMNFIVAIALFTAMTMITGVPDANRPGALIGGVAPGSPAEQAGLRTGDRIVAAGAAALMSAGDLKTYTDSHLGEPIVYRIERGAAGAGAPQSLEFTIVPRVNPPPNQGALGVQIGLAYRPARVWEALGAGVGMTGEIIAMTFLVPATLIREGRPISEAGFMGPVGIAAATGEVVRSALAVDSILPILSFVALLSAALGITNLLPIPALDGGRLLFVLVEAIRGKRVEPAQESLVHMVGFGMLLLLVGVITVREIGALLNGTFPTLGLH